MGDILADIEPDYNQANTLFNTKASLERAALALERAEKNIEDKAELLAKTISRRMIMTEQKSNSLRRKSNTHKPLDNMT